MPDNSHMGTQPPNQPFQAQVGQNPPQHPGVAPTENDLLAQALQGSSMQLVPTSSHTSAIEPGGLNLIDLIFNNAAARKHLGIMNYNQDVAEETDHAMGLTSALILNFMGNSMQNEAAMEQIIVQLRNSKMALTSAPLYVQLARQMQLQSLPEIAQTGINHIKHKLERR